MGLGGGVQPPGVIGDVWGPVWLARLGVLLAWVGGDQGYCSLPRRTIGPHCPRPCRRSGLTRGRPVTPRVRERPGHSVTPWGL